MEQLNLLKNKPKRSYRSDEYILSKNNIQIYQQLIIEKWQQHCIILYGKSGTGKTHLANIWQESNSAILVESWDSLSIMKKYKAYIIEDIENISNESELLHYYNFAKENSCKLLLTTSTLPLSYKLPDLNSRLLSVPLLKLIENDEYILRVIVLKEFLARQIKVSKEIIEYIINHTERSIPELKNIVHSIDLLSMQNRKNITIPFIKEIINTNI